MTQYVRVTYRTSKYDRPVGTILKVRNFDDTGFYTEKSELLKGYAGYYLSQDYELIPEEIVNSSLFKIMNEID